MVSNNTVCFFIFIFIKSGYGCIIYYGEKCVLFNHKDVKTKKMILNVIKVCVV